MMTPRDAELIQAQIFQRMSADRKMDLFVELWKFAKEINQSGRYGSEPKDTSGQGRQTVG